MLKSSLDQATVLKAIAAAPRIVLVSVVLALLSACGVVSAAGSVAGGAVDLTVDAVDTVTDVATAPF